MSSHVKSAEGDWICSDLRCGNLNFARRTSCNRCGKQKEISSDNIKKKQGIEIGKVAAEKSHGLFSAEDWQCSKCGNVNWARRQTCNMCNAPKVGEVEERTGYGGGFNEREGVEYIQREESDDEFDEFGRRKKKFRSAGGKMDDKSENSRDNLTKVKDKEVEEDDEEEDDDDEDLSKYDLWQDDDEDEDIKEDEKSESVKNDKDENSKSSRRDSRSVSSSSSSPHSRHSSTRSSRCHSSSNDRSSSRDRGRKSPRRYRDRSRSRERHRRNRRTSRSWSRSRSRSRSRERKYSRR